MSYQGGKEERGELTKDGRFDCVVSLILSGANQVRTLYSRLVHVTLKLLYLFVHAMTQELWHQAEQLFEVKVSQNQSLVRELRRSQLSLTQGVTVAAFELFNLPAALKVSYY